MSTLLVLSVPRAHKLMQEYSAEMALICTVSGEKECARGADFIAEKLGATREDEIRGTIKIMDDMMSHPKKKTPTSL